MVEKAASRRRFYFKFSLLFYLIWFLCFAAVGKYASTLPTRDITSSLDRIIPLVPAFVWPYELCYVFPFLPLFVLQDWHRFNRAVLAVILANLTAYVFYILFPISFPRPRLGHSISEAVLGLEYSFDFSPGANKLPSLHVAFAWVVYFVCRGQVRKKVWEYSLLSAAILITVSTVFVKQHVVADALSGILWAFGGWWLAERLYPRLADVAGEPRRALFQMLHRIWPFIVVGFAALFLAADLRWERLVRW